MIWCLNQRTTEPADHQGEQVSTGAYLPFCFRVCASDMSLSAVGQIVPPGLASADFTKHPYQVGIERLIWGCGIFRFPTFEGVCQHYGKLNPILRGVTID